MADSDLNHAARLVAAPRAEVWRAFMDPQALVQWLPPGRMTGRMHAFDPRPGGGYEMSLDYPPDAPAGRGKSADREDRVKVRFVEVQPPARIVEAVVFASDDPAFGGEMTITIALEPRGEATEVVMTFENLPPGLRPQDNAEGARQSLEQLAAWVEK